MSPPKVNFLLARQTPTALFLGDQEVVGRLVCSAEYLGDWPAIVVAERLTEWTRDAVLDPRIKGVVLISESPFSHGANVLRALRSRSRPDLVCAFATGLSLNNLTPLEECVLSPRDMTIKIGATTSKFAAKDFGTTFRLGVLLANPTEICYRPAYQLSPELADLAGEGYRRLGTSILRIPIEARADSGGRLWVSGLGWPSDLARWALAHQEQFLQEIHSYASLLVAFLRVFDLAQPELDDELKRFLPAHYCFSPLVGLTEEPLAELLLSETSLETLDKVLSEASVRSPLSGQVAIGQAAAATQSLVRRTLSDSRREQSGKANFLRSALISVVVLGDTRRLVIAGARSRSTWFKKISRHRDAIDAQWLGEGGVRC